MEHQATETINNRYTLQYRLGKGGMGAVFRAFDRLHRGDVALKRLLAMHEEDGSQAATDASMGMRVALANEFQTLASLHHPHIIRVLDYGFDIEKQPYFTMSLLEGARPLTEWGQGKPLEEQISLIVQMLQALAYLHRRNIIHRDLKPENALVTADGSVKVLDFGLAMEQTDKEEAEVAGTIAYMAPEILQGSAVTRSSDLYAVGVMAFELIAGHHPFSTDNPGLLIQDIFFTDPDVDVLDVPDGVANVITRLMLKDPGLRYDQATDVIEDLSLAIGKTAPEETAAIRESYLQAAEFVGREQEMSQLQAALAQAIQGKGSTWIIGGESGVGKSRLLDEVRTQAMVRGALVVHGQAVAEGGIAYQMWRDPLRRLILSTVLEDSDASVLKQIVTDIGELLERDIPVAPELEGSAGQHRLMEMVSTVIRRQEQPLVLVLEDLQWAVESLDVVRHISPVAGELPLLVIGSYRDDEAPDMPEQLPNAQFIKLDRFSENGIEQLSASMLGEVGSRPEVLSLLKRETEGNVFFLVEVVRALAEDAGSLQRIGHMTLPAHIFAGGVQQVVQRRLTHVPQDALYLLQAAAIFGRYLDVKLLQKIEPDLDIDAWLVTCSNVAVLEVSEQQWRFAHDKLRDGLLSDLTEEQTRALHVLIAEKLQEVYAAKIDPYAAIIANHYEAADALRYAQYWHARAGQHARELHANVLSYNHYQRALELYDRIDEPIVDENSVSRLRMLQDFAYALNAQGRTEEAISYLKQLNVEAQEAQSAYHQVVAWAISGFYELARGNIEPALENLEHAEPIARDANLLDNLAKVLWMKGWCVLRMGDMDRAIALGEEALALSKEVDDKPDLAQAANLLAVIHMYLGHYDLATGYFTEALTIQEAVGEITAATTTINNIGWLQGARGDYETALDYFNRAIKRSQDSGHRGNEYVTRGNRVGALVRLGRFAEAVQEIDEVIDFALIAELAELSEMYRFQAEAYLGSGRLQDGLEAAQQALELGMDMKNPEYIGAAWRVLGLVAAQMDRSVEIEINGELQKIFALTCFAESERICRESEIMVEQAHTLKVWALYELNKGHQETALEQWKQARKIFHDIGADKEYERMPESPLD